MSRLSNEMEQCKTTSEMRKLLILFLNSYTFWANDHCSVTKLCPQYIFILELLFRTIVTIEHCWTTKNYWDIPVAYGMSNTKTRAPNPTSHRYKLAKGPLYWVHGKTSGYHHASKSIFSKCFVVFLCLFSWLLLFHWVWLTECEFSSRNYEQKNLSIFIAWTPTLVQVVQIAKQT